MSKEDNKLSLKQKIFGILMIIASLVMIYYGVSLGFKTISSSRFILGGLFIFILAIALFKNKVNTKPVGIIFLIYLILDAVLVISYSLAVSTNIILEIIFILIVIYFLFIKKKK
jgi:hypothetical protein